MCSAKEQSLTKCSGKEQSHSVLKSKEYHINQCVKDKVPVPDVTRKQECQANVYKEGEKNCQVNTQPVKSAKELSHMQSVKRPNMLQSSNKQYIYEECPVKSMCSDKNCQETQSINVWPVKPSMDMWLPKPAVPYKYIRFCSDKNCQSTRCYKKVSSETNVW